MKLDALTKQAINHTLHCLLGCSIGEILGMVLATAMAWSNAASILISVVLAFFFGYLLTFRSIYRKHDDVSSAAKATLATDTVSITSMEIVDNIFILLVPGAISATLSSTLFWWSLLVSLAVAFAVTVPVNRYMMSRGSGHGHHH
jgi:putative flippase GtrA